MYKGHSVQQCSSRSCWVCSQKHNTILHDSFQASDNTVAKGVSSEPISQPSTSSQVSLVNITPDQVLLATVQVKIQISNNNFLIARCLLDAGSQVSFVTKRFFQKTNLTSFNHIANIFGIDQNKTRLQNYVNIPISSRYDKTYQFQEQCGIIDNITIPLPQAQILKSSLNIPSELFLADTTFNSPGEIDILLGASVFYDCLQPHQIRLGNNLPVLQLTRFGYVVAGDIIRNSGKTQSSNLHSFLATQSQSQDERLDEILTHFWRLEEISAETNIPPSAQKAEEHFLNTVQVKNQRVYVKLPFKEEFDVADLSGSFNIALRRFLLLERQFAQNSELFIQYKKFIDEYLALGHAKITHVDVNNSAEISSNCYFLPHQAVIKASSTTDLRVVFDGSAVLQPIKV